MLGWAGWVRRTETQDGPDRTQDVMNLAVVIELLCFLVDVSEDREEGGTDRTDSL